MEFLRWEVNEDLLSQARNWTECFSTSRSIRNDDGANLVGNLGEVIFSKMYPDAVRLPFTDEADFLFKGLRVEVKTKDRTVGCKAYYDAGVQAYQKDYDVDWYVFYSWNTRGGFIEYLGWMEKAKFYEKARFCTKGSIDPANGWVVSRDCYVVLISELIR